MFFISHRGNINGPNPVDENKVQYINDCLDKNFDVEIDLWFKKNQFYLGHDEPQYEVGLDYLSNKKFWIHCKNLECFYELSKYDLNYFWHEKDKIVITSKGFFGIILVQNLIEIKVLTFSQSVQKNLITP